MLMKKLRMKVISARYGKVCGINEDIWFGIEGNDIHIFGYMYVI